MCVSVLSVWLQQWQHLGTSYKGELNPRPQPPDILQDSGSEAQQSGCNSIFR